MPSEIAAVPQQLLPSELPSGLLCEQHSPQSENDKVETVVMINELLISATSALPASSPPSRFFRFMDLPADLRVQIYEELLVVGKVFYRPSEDKVQESSERFEDHEKYLKPSLAVLRVSKAVQKEAEYVYLTSLFVLPRHWYLLGALTGNHDGILEVPIASTSLQLLSKKGMKHIKHVSVETPQNSGMEHAIPASYWRKVEEQHPGHFDRLEHRMRIAHTTALDVALVQRKRMFAKLAHFTNLETIEIDLAGAYCPQGCCRFLHVDWNALWDIHPSHVNVLGLRNEDEVEEALADWERKNHGKREHWREFLGLEINPEEDEWAWWKWMTKTRVAPMGMKRCDVVRRHV